MIKGYFKALAGMFCVLAMALSCQKEVEKYDEVVLDPISIGQNMRAAVFEIELKDMDYVSNEWYLFSPTADTWLTHEIIPSTKSMWVMIDGNLTGSVRESYIQVRCKGQALKVIVKQDCEPVLEISRASANFKYQGGSQTVKVLNFADLVDLKAETESTWCDITVKNDSIILTAQANQETERREAVLNITATRSISGDKVEKKVTLSQDKHGQRPSYEYSTDGQTWLEDLPSQFEVLYVRTNNGVKLSGVDMDAFKAALASQSAPAGLNLRESEYEENTFPMDVFGATATKPNKTLKSIAFPKNVTSIAASAFVYCEALETVDLSGIATIGEQAFRYSGLKTLNIPNNVVDMGTYAFADNKFLTSVYYNSSKPDDSSKTNYYLFYITGEDQTAKLTITIGPDITRIPRTAFRHNNNLTKLVVEGPFMLRNYPLIDCKYLDTIEFLSTDDAQISAMYCGTLWDNNSGGNLGANAAVRNIVVPKGKKSQYAANATIGKIVSEAKYTIVEAQ